MLYSPACPRCCVTFLNRQLPRHSDSRDRLGARRVTDLRHGSAWPLPFAESRRFAKDKQVRQRGEQDDPAVPVPLLLPLTLSTNDETATLPASRNPVRIMESPAS